MPRTSQIDVRVRLRGSRSFNSQVRQSATELEAMGVRGAASLARFSQKAEQLKDFGRRWTMGVTLPVAALGYVAGKVAVDFEKSMRNVNSIAQLGEGRFERLSESVVDLSGSTAQEPKVLADAMYDLVSSGFAADKALGVLKSSATAATAGLTTAETATAAVAGVLNAYRLPASEAQKVSDLLFRTVDRGVITFEELASTIGDVLPFASSLGVGLDEIGGSISTMTKAGIKAPETMTRIKALMSSLLKPSTDLKNTIAELGYESGEAMIKQLGFQGTLEALAESTGGSKEELAKLFPNVRALGGALALTGDNAKGAQEDLAGMADAIGATGEALSEQKKSKAFKFQQLKADLKALAIEVMPPLIEVAGDLADKLKDLVKGFRSLPNWMQETVVWGLVAAATLGPLTWVVGTLARSVGFLIIGLAWFVGVAGKARAAIQLLGLFMGITSLSTLGWVGAIIAVVAALVLAYKNVKWFRDGVDAVFGWIKEHWYLLPVILAAPFLLLPALVATHLGTVIDEVKKLPGKVKDVLVGVGGIVLAPFKWAWQKIKGVLGDIVGKFKTAVEDIKSTADDVTGFLNPLGGGGPNIPNPLDLLPFGASGFSNFPGGLAVVGEEGPELAFLPRGTDLASNRRSRRLVSSSTKLQPLPAGAGRDDRELEAELLVPLTVDGRKMGEALVRVSEKAKGRS